MGLVAYVIQTIGNGCGMDDGPFHAVPVRVMEPSENAQIFNLAENGKLVLDNRNDTLSPVITWIEYGKIKWSLDMDTRHTKGYETTRLWKMSHVTNINNTNPIKLHFTGHWTYGAEAGYLEINRENGENHFCLSW